MGLGRGSRKFRPEAEILVILSIEVAPNSPIETIKFMNRYKNVNETFASNHTKSVRFGINPSYDILLNSNIKMVLIIIHVANVVSEIFCLMRTTVQLSGVISRYSIRSKVPRSYIGR